MKHILRVAVAALTVGLGIAFAGAAHADANTYLQAMRNNHVVPGHISESEAVNQGMQACRAMRSGQSARALAEQLANTYDDAASANIVGNAHDYLCPDAPVDFGRPGDCPLFRRC
jgi:hypothetical protein